MAQQTINVGTSANSGGGDPLRDAMIKINENFTELYGDITSLEDGHIVTDVQGSVYADDSTLLVDGVNGTIPASVLTGALPAIDGSALTGISGGGGLADLVDDTTPQLGGNLDLNNFDITGTGDIPAANLTGTLPALDGSALTGVTASSIAFADVTGTPTTIAGYGITDAFDGAFGSLTGTPTTIAGYGITDAVTAGGDFEGNLSGSVFADDSTLLVDGVNGIVNISNQSINALSDIDTTTIAPSRSMQPLIWDDVDQNWYPGNGISLTSILTMEDNSFIMLRENAYLNFEGSSTDAFDTKLDVVNPTANRTIRLPDADGTIALASTTLAGYGITDAQAALVSGTNIKTVNGESLLGSGNITISGGSGGAAFTNIGIGADDSTIRSISEGESFLILGGTGVTTASDAEGNITITGFDGAFSSLTGTPTTISGYGITDALTAGGALEGSSLQPTDETSASTQGTTLALSGGDSTGLNSDGGDLTLVGGNGSSGTHGDISIGATQTGSITIGSGTNSVDFTSGTTVDFTGTTVTGLNVSGLQSRGTVTGTTSSLADAAEADLDITGFKSYALLAITTDRAARVRLYVSSATRTADASRAEGVDPTSDAGLIAEVITTGAETVIISPGAFGFNLESSPTTTIPCRVTNKSGSTSTVQVDLNILQLEA